MINEYFHTKTQADRHSTIYLFIIYIRSQGLCNYQEVQRKSNTSSVHLITNVYPHQK